MADSSGSERSAPTAVKSTFRQAFLSGVALTIPLFVTLLVVGFVVNTLSNVLDPVVVFAFDLTGSQLEPSETPTYLVKLVAASVLLLGILAIGLVAEQRSAPGRFESMFDATMERIPGVGSIYTSFDEMSQMLLDSDTQSFQEVVLVEHPTAESYTVAFVTASTPPEIERATDSDEMVTLFMPMAPNPVMGGHVVHVPTSRVYDVDMTVEEGIRSIVTSGVAIGESGVEVPLGGAASTDRSYPPQTGYHAGGDHREPTPRTGATDRASAYRNDIDPEHARTPDAVAETDREEPVGDAADHHEDLERADGTIGDDTDHPAAFEQDEDILGSTSGTPSDIESSREEQN
ncbi:DUF502 domain-containing protein [Haloarcula onubensis]|uniref:DUF502 domain-containing protein n=1 Tax=Haloarcula onubensis TaxID=2950539 RepID=A0ABU2FVA8_9EURY|nr:DUF502 domain-containing protein [Halomicroarcula sp. S3CR25-11]MDS0284167.1 DUF502 domain-containing protein [Halomicroarcula sp. S3CR25-11]